MKGRADRAFNKAQFAKAHDLYEQALGYDQFNYDIMACLVGAALNMGSMDKVFDKSSLLIRWDEAKAQVDRSNFQQKRHI